LDKNVLIIGKGKVGLATGKSLSCQVSYHDPAKGEVQEDLSPYDFVIVCVDSLQDGPKDHKDLVSVLDYLDSKQYHGIVAIRSTVHPEFVAYVKDKPYDILFFPEFLIHRQNYFKEQSPWAAVVGGDPAPRSQFLSFLYNVGYIDNLFKVKAVSALEAVVIKLSANAVLATKVLTFNAIFEICQLHGIDYLVVRDSIVADTRIGESHTTVPSPDDGLMGFGGHCLPKDILAIADVDTLGFFENVSNINKKIRSRVL
jgi:UDP-glucose 6-dehydrogenase